MNRIRFSIAKIVVVALFIALLPCCGAFAEEAETHTSGEFAYVVQEDGTAKITDYTGDASSLTVPEALDGYAVTAIGDSAFSNCESLAEITLPDSLTVIGDQAFAWCNSITEITLPDGLTTIGDSAFAWCVMLAEITLPDSLTSIGNEAFYSCFNLSSIIVGRDSYVMEYCIAHDLPYSYAEEHSWGDFTYIVKKDRTARITDYSGNASKLTVPKRVNGYVVTAIGNMAFYDCKNLTEITLPDSLTAIGDWAFAWCGNLTEITLPDSLKSIGDNPFSASGIQIFHVSSEHPLLGTVDGVLFSKPDKRLIYYPSSRTDSAYTVPEGTLVIDDEAFSYCENLTEITLPDSLESIGSNPFMGCSVQSIHVSPDHPFFGTIGGVLYSKPDKRLISYPAGRTDSAYAVPEGILVIGDEAFYGCYNLTEITLPDSLTAIGDGAFVGSYNLSEIAMSDSVTTIGNYAFAGCHTLTEITLPDSLTAIGDEAFSYCDNLTEITLPDSLTTIGEWAFHNCFNLSSIIVGRDSYAMEYCIANDLPYSYAEEHSWGDFTYVVKKDRTARITDYSGNASELTVPKKVNGYVVTVIGNRAFAYCENLIKITLPDSVTTIGDFAFSYCKNLREITLPDSLTAIGHTAFSSCHNLTKITLPDSLTSIGHSAFSRCGNLTEITLPDGLTTIEDGIFSDCYSLTKITLPDSVTAIGDRAFANCNSLTEIPLPDSVTAIGDWAFSGCNNLTEIMIPDNVTTIGEGVFSDCDTLTEIKIPDKVTTIGDWAFSGCNNLTEIIIPDKVTTIGKGAFSVSNNLTEITLPGSLTAIGDKAFYCCRNLSSIIVGQDSYAMEYCVANNLPYSVRTE